MSRIDRPLAEDAEIFIDIG